MTGIKSPAEEPGARGSTNGSIESSKHQCGNTAKQIDVAICGVGLRLAGGIHSIEEFWQALVGGLVAEGSASNAQKSGQLNRSLSAFDARFFTMAADGRIDSDPYSQKLFEVVHECLEDACEVNYRGEKASVACYVAMPGRKDVEAREKGNASTVELVSKQFEFRGPR